MKKRIISVKAIFSSVLFFALLQGCWWKKSSDSDDPSSAPNLPVEPNPIELPLDDGPDVVAGDEFNCALKDNALTCWGNSYDKYVPELVNPRQISAGLEHVCAIDDTGAKCWKNACLTKLEIPNLVNPTQIVSGERHACALDDKGVKCWGVAIYQRYDLGTVPTLSNPKKIFSSPGGRNTCAIDDTGLKCWGDNTFGQLNYAVPALVNPRQVAMTHKNFCALDDDGLKCWGDNSIGQLDVPLTLTHPRQISIGPRQITTGWGFDICALDTTDAECWANNSGTWVQDSFGPPPTLTKPARIASGSSHACVVEESGIKCWGANVRGQLNVPIELSDFAVVAPRTETATEVSDAVQCPPKQ